MASDVFRPAPRGGLLSGRDEDGFVRGGVEARAARRYTEDGEMDTERREARRRELRKERALLCPVVITKGAKARARKAASILGVDVPEWAERPAPEPFTEEHKRKLSESKKREWERRG